MDRATSIRGDAPTAVNGDAQCGSPCAARRRKSRRIVPKRPEIYPLFGKAFAEKKLAELHDPSSVSAVAERAAYYSFTQGIIDHENNDAFSEEVLKAFSDLLQEGEECLQSRLDVLKEAHRRALIMGAYILEEREAALSASPAGDSQ